MRFEGDRSMFYSTSWLLLLILLDFIPVLASAGDDADRQLLTDAQKSFAVLPDMKQEDGHSSAKVSLGRSLFFEPRVSRDGTVSCARCHQPSLYGTDALPKSIGVDHRLNVRNAPTILNTSLQMSQHWVGDRINVEVQKGLSGIQRSTDS